MTGLLAMAALAAGLAAAQPGLDGSSAQPRLLTSPNALRDLAKSLAKSPSQSAAPIRFRLELPLANDKKSDIEDLQNSAGWRADDRFFTINFDMGVVTPQNFDAFEKDDLFNAPPLRVLYFWTRRTREQSLRVLPGIHADDASAALGYYEPTESYGLAVPTSAQARAVSGGDLPDDFALPFALRFPRPPGNPSAVAAGLRIRIEGELRTVRGQAVLCGIQRNGAGYAVDEITQKTPYTVVVTQCLLPAVIERISLVRLTGGPPLKEWTRAARPPTPETDETKVMTQRDPRLLAAPATTVSPDATPNTTAPLPKRAPG